MGENYFCGDKEDESYLIETYNEWNQKWYSPLCRPWFKKQSKTIEYGTLTDPYLFAHPPGQMGITPCMPIIDDTGSEPRFFGALCIDSQLNDRLSKYFPMQDGSASSLLFKSDLNYERSTFPLFVMGNDELFDSIR